MDKGATLKILHIITDLDTGGAEMMLYKLLAAHQYAADCEIEPMVISLMERGPVTERIESLGVSVVSLGMRQGEKPGLDVIRKLFRQTRQFRPQVIQGWMYHGNIAATLARLSLLMGGSGVGLYWNIRQTLYDFSNEKRMTRLLIHLSAWLVWLPKTIIYNSDVSAAQHEAVGFPVAKRHVIGNGFDLDQFSLDLEAGRRQRERLGISEDAWVVGHVSRFHPMKGHATLLRVAAHVVEQLPQGNSVRFVLIGRGVDVDEPQLVDQITSLQLTNHVLLLGEQSEIPALMSSFDLVVSPSAWGEGFPNVIGEAMACGRPCVVTDVGDSAKVVGKGGIVVDVDDDKAMADAILSLLLDAEKRDQMATAAVSRVSEKYGIDQIAGQYLELYQCAGS